MSAPAVFFAVLALILGSYAGASQVIADRAKVAMRRAATDGERHAVRVASQRWLVVVFVAAVVGVLAAGATFVWCAR